MTPQKPKIIFLGHLPPPYMGPSIATQIILNSSLRKKYLLIHLDLSDRRDLSKLGRVDWTNIMLAIKHYVSLLYLILRHWPQAVYIPHNQTTIGYLRDIGFIAISKLLGRKVICHLRGGNFRNWYNESSSFMRLLVRFFHHKVDAQIVLGENLRSLFEGLVPSEKIFVVPNGRNFPQTGWTEKENSRPKVLFLANLRKEKGVFDFLKASSLIHANYPSVEFVLAGGWRSLFEKKIFEEFCQNHPEIPLFLVGTVVGEDKWKLFREADIFVFPPCSSEGHPWVIVEALAHGLPVIATEQGCISESVFSEKNGFLVEVGKPEQIAEKVRILLENKELLNTMGQNSYRLYQEKFTEENLVIQMDLVFQKVFQKVIS